MTVVQQSDLTPSAREKFAEDRLALLARAAGALICVGDSAELLPRILETSREMIAADAYALWQLDAAGGWHIGCSAGLSEAYGLSRLGLQGGRITIDSTVIIEDVEKEHVFANRRDLYRAEGIRSLLVLPLRVRNIELGTLVLYYRAPRQFDHLDVTLAEAVASLASAAIDNASSYHAQSQLRTQAEAREQRYRFLAEASRALASSLDYEGTLKSLAQLAVPDLADWCIVDLLEESKIRRVAVAHVDPAKVAWGWEMAEKYPPDINASAGVGATLRGGDAQLYPVIRDEQFKAVARDAEHLRILREGGAKSAMIVPLCARGRTCGAMTFVSTREERHFELTDLALAEELARRAGLAVDNARLYRDAQDANRAKDQFMAILSHELRTPLTPVLGMLDVLARDSRVPPELHADLLTIRRNVELEARLIDDLLDLTRVTKGKLQLTVEVMDAHAAIREVCAMCRGEARTRNLELLEELQATAHHIHADAARLRQMLWNLLRNAIKFTPAGGLVRVQSAMADPGTLRIRIIDNGMGIEPRALPTIFDAFTQGHAAAAHGGLGLGLAITRGLADLHGASISAQSAGPGRGATFTLEFPVCAPAADGQLPGTLLQPNGPVLRILLVEDHDDSANVLRRLLESRGHTVHTARNMAQGLELARALALDLLISDIGLPDGTGMELLRNLDGRRPPAIALSGFGMESDVTASLAAGFVAHLTKPVNLDRLEAVIHNATATNGGRR